MKKAALHNLGCKVNAYETEAMQHLLEEAGYASPFVLLQARTQGKLEWVVDHRPFS